jgi:hypothetical protein
MTLHLVRGEEGFHQYEVKGYEGNPVIAGTEWKVHDNARPQPVRVTPGTYTDPGKAPSDAEILFDGTSMDHFQDTEWCMKNGVIVAGKGGLSSRKAYGDCRLHVEWRVPAALNTQEPSCMGNSGIFLMGRYELQVFDSYSCRIYADGSAAAIYGQTPPMFNACRKPGEWQTFDIFFMAPVFEDDKLVNPAYITVLHNGVFVHINTEITGPTKHNKVLPYTPHKARMPFYLQGHGSPVEYRNIWIRDLEE